MFVAAFIDFMVSTFLQGVRATTGQEIKWLASAPPEMQGQMRAQIELQKEQELVLMLARTFSALCGWQKDEMAFEGSESGRARSRVRYARHA
jgi:hypothetical protein